MLEWHACRWLPCSHHTWEQPHIISGLDIAAAGAPGQASPKRQTLRLRGLPLRVVGFPAQGTLVAAGFDGEVLLFTEDSQGVWHYVKSLAGASLVHLF